MYAAIDFGFFLSAVLFHHLSFIEIKNLYQTKPLVSKNKMPLPASGMNAVIFILLLLLFYIIFFIFIQSSSGMAGLTMSIIGALEIVMKIRITKTACREPDNLIKKMMPY